jgi:hypothetical protein
MSFEARVRELVVEARHCAEGMDVIVAEPGGRFVQFAGGWNGDIRLEITSDYYLEPDHRWSESDRLLFGTLGFEDEKEKNWGLGIVEPTDATPDFIASLTTRVLRDLSEIQSPSDLEICGHRGSTYFQE